MIVHCISHLVIILSMLFVIKILFSVILFLFFVVRSRIKVLSSSVLLFVVCRSFRRFVFYSAIGVIIFLIKSVICFDFPLISLWLLLGLYHFWVFLMVCYFCFLCWMSNSFRWFLLWCEFYYFYHFYFGAILGRHLISCMFHVEGVLHICTIWWP